MNGFNPDTTQTVIVCVSNQNMAFLARLNAFFPGVTMIVARDGADLIVKAQGDVRPDAIVLSNDLKYPSTDDLVKTLNADPRLRGVRVIILKSGLRNLMGALNGFRMPPNRSLR